MIAPWPGICLTAALRFPYVHLTTLSAFFKVNGHFGGVIGPKEAIRDVREKEARLIKAILESN